MEISGNIILATRLKILQATALALVLAGVILIGAVLPAEYGIDILKIGRLTGLNRLYQHSNNPTRTHAPHSQKYRDHVAEITLAPGQGQEYKFAMEPGDSLLYSWNASGAVFFDFHGEPKGATNNYFESYDKKEGNQAHGSFVAPFKGTHGWNWKNRTGEPVVITLTATGFFQVVGNPQKAK